MDLLFTIAITLLTLAILVVVHEYGHYWVARRCGVQVLRFSFGFGKPLFGWSNKHGTQFSVAAFPLGGYVKMLGEHDNDVPEDQLHLAFNRKPVTQRIAIVSAGPLANLALAVVAYWGLYLAGESGYVPLIDAVAPESIAAEAGLQPGQEIVAVDGEATPTREALSFQLLDRIGDTGSMTISVKLPDSDVVQDRQANLERWLSEQDIPDLFGGLGVTLYMPEVEARVGEVLPDSPAQRAGLEAGDQLLTADAVAMSRWEDWVAYVRARPDQPIQLEVQRGSSQLKLLIVPERVEGSDGEVFGRVGVAPVMPEMPQHLVRKFQRGPLEAFTAAVARTGELTVFTVTSIQKMITGLISHKNLSGPITIAKVASITAKSGLESYIGFLALLSVSLGVLNLLPIPVLDGGHLLFYTLELLAGRPVPEKIQALGYQLGLFLVLGIMVLALYNDIVRL